METQVKSEWRGAGETAELWWTINGDAISDRDLRLWCFHNMGESNPSRYVDVVRKCHVDAYAARAKS